MHCCTSTSVIIGGNSNDVMYEKRVGLGFTPGNPRALHLAEKVLPSLAALSLFDDVYEVNRTYID